MLNLLPYDVIGEISKYINTPSDLVSFKLVNSDICIVVKSFKIIKLKLYEGFNKIKDKKLCANSNCYYETFDVFIDNYREYEGRYIHCHQYAMNMDNIIFNKDRFTVFSPYCHDCYKNYVLLCGEERENTKDLSCEGFIDVEISNN